MQKNTLKKLGQQLKAVADPTRIKILAMLSRRSLCVCEITFALGLAQPTVSRHLRQLENTGFVSSQREGSWIIYRLAPADEFCRKELELVLARALETRECNGLFKILEGLDRRMISSCNRQSLSKTDKP